MLLLLLSLGCAKHQGTTDLADSDQLRLVAAALDSGAGLLGAFAPIYQSDQDVVLCAGATALASALASAADAVEGVADAQDGGAAVLPALGLDLSACDLGEVGAGAADAAQRIAPLATVALNAGRMLLYSVELGCRAEAWLLASVAYAEGVQVAVVAEMAAPDWQLSIPSVSVALSECE